jgi:hypothetical protein
VDEPIKTREAFLGILIVAKLCRIAIGRDNMPPHLILDTDPSLQSSFFIVCISPRRSSTSLKMTPSQKVSVGRLNQSLSTMKKAASFTII